MNRLIKAFYSSIAAFKFGWQHETALRQEMVVLALSFPVSFILTTDPWKLIALWASIMAIMVAEFLNTGIEKVADRVTLEHDELIKVAKDCGSAAVLVASCMAGLVWLLAAWERFVA